MSAPVDLPVPWRSGRFRRNWSFVGARFGRLWHARVLFRAWRPWLAILAVILIVLVAAMGMAATIDLPAATWAKGLAKPTRKAFLILTRYGKSDWILIGSAIVFALLTCGDWHRVRKAVAAAWAEVGTIAAFLFFAVAGSGITVNIVKQLVGRARPRALPDAGPFTFEPFAFDSIYQGFPSGHAQVMGAVAAVAVLVTPRWSFLVVIPALSIAATRVIVGAHYPSDVVAGLVLGAGFTWLYAVAMAEAGIGFSIHPNGLIRSHTMAIRRVGGCAMVRGLWSALFGGAVSPARRSA